MAYSSLQQALFIAFLIAAFVGSWIVAGLTVSRLTGWHDLARRFALQGEFPCEQWRFKTALMRHASHYNNCLTIGASPVGFYIAMLSAFRFGHPPLFIPWSEISYSHTKVLWWRMVRFQLGRENPVPFTVREDLAERIQRAAGPSWPVERFE